MFFLAPTKAMSSASAWWRNARAASFTAFRLTGVTGERDELPAGNLRAFIARVRAQTQQRLVLGFGISTPAQARSMNGLVDGFVVGSALVRAGAEGPAAVASWRPPCERHWKAAERDGMTLLTAAAARATICSTGQTGSRKVADLRGAGLRFYYPTCEARGALYAGSC